MTTKQFDEIKKMFAEVLDVIKKGGGGGAVVAAPSAPVAHPLFGEGNTQPLPPAAVRPTYPPYVLPASDVTADGLKYSPRYLSTLEQAEDLQHGIFMATGVRLPLTDAAELMPTTTFRYGTSGLRLYRLGEKQEVGHLLAARHGWNRVNGGGVGAPGYWYFPVAGGDVEWMPQ